MVQLPITRYHIPESQSPLLLVLGNPALTVRALGVGLPTTVGAKPPSLL